MSDHDLNPFSETRVSGEQIFDGQVLKVWRDCVRRAGEDDLHTREFIRHPGATVVIAVTDAGCLLLERQFRYPLAQVLIELPAGKLDPHESILTCAQRELREETGFNASQWRHLGVLHPAVGYSDERIEIFLAQGLEFVGQQLDHGEYIEVIEWTLEEAEAAVFDGRITDAKTITCLFWARKALRG